MFARLSTVLLYALFAFTLLAAARPGGVTPTKTVTVTAVSLHFLLDILFDVLFSMFQDGSRSNCHLYTCIAMQHWSALICNTVHGYLTHCTGDIQCCNSVQMASSENAGLLLGLLGIILGTLDVLVGVTCSPITIIGGGSSSCTAEPVCCENNSFVSLCILIPMYFY